MGAKDLAIAVAHEGQHLADAQGYAAAMTAELGGGPNAKSSATNRTHYEQEVRGYTVSALTAKGLGLSALKFGNYEIWNSKIGLQPAQLNGYLSSSKVYGLSPANPGNKYYNE
jgi:hypothetical protein